MQMPRNFIPLLQYFPQYEWPWFQRWYQGIYICSEQEKTTVEEGGYFKTFSQGGCKAKNEYSI